MTIQEFKAWLDGFTEGIEDAPTVKQWARIKERVMEIEESVMPQAYQPTYWPFWSTPWPVTNPEPWKITYGPTNGFYLLGASEAQAMTA